MTHAGRLDSETRLGPWLFAVARNLHISYCRSRAIEERAADSDWVVAGGSPGLAIRSCGRQRAGTADRGRARQYSVSFREVLLLVGVEGLRPTEAAAICGVTPEALRQRLKRARALLAARLAEMGLRPSVDLGECANDIQRADRSVSFACWLSCRHHQRALHGTNKCGPDATLRWLDGMFRRHAVARRTPLARVLDVALIGAVCFYAAATLVEAIRFVGLQ